jgi:hypothetical protein
MLTKLLYFLFVMFLLAVSSILFILIGEYFAGKFKSSRFTKWWRRNVITQMPENYED